MQKILITAVAIMMSVAAIAQKEIVWFDVGLKAQYGATGLFNSAACSLKIENKILDYSDQTVEKSGCGLNFSYFYGIFGEISIS